MAKVLTGGSVGTPDLSVSFCGIELKNPVVAASGTFGYGIEFEDIVTLDRVICCYPDMEQLVGSWKSCLMRCSMNASAATFSRKGASRSPPCLSCTGRVFPSSIRWGTVFTSLP